MSPAFPIGAFAYSHGLEKAAEDGQVAGPDRLATWLADLIRHGSLRNDLVLLAAAWHATTAGDRAALMQIADLGLALQPTAERHLETVTQGNAFLATVKSAWPMPRLCDLARGGDTAYPVAVALAAASHAIPLPATLLAYSIAFASNLVSAAIRLSLIGQTDGQRILAALMPTIREAAAFAEQTTLDDIGSAGFASDLASLRHETQYTRLFRS